MKRPTKTELIEAIEKYKREALANDMLNEASHASLWELLGGLAAALAFFEMAETKDAGTD